MTIPGSRARRGPAGRRAALTTYLDYLRDTVVRKVDRLPEGDAHRSALSSG